MRNHTRLAAFAGLTSIVLAGSLGCADRNKMAEAAAHPMTVKHAERSGQMLRIYDYYPNSQVYYSAFQDRYFWLDESKDEWKSGTELPAEIRISPYDQEIVELATSTPYVYHEQVLEQHPSLDTLRAQADDAQAESFEEAIANVPLD